MMPAMAATKKARTGTAKKAAPKKKAAAKPAAKKAKAKAAGPGAGKKGAAKPKKKKAGKKGKKGVVARIKEGVSTFFAKITGQETVTSETPQQKTIDVKTGDILSLRDKGTPPPAPKPE